MMLAAGVAPYLVLVSTTAAEEPTTVLSRITIQGQGGGDAKGPTQGFVAENSVSATKTGRAILETPQSISVITQDQIRQRDAQSLGEALNYTAGVVGQPFGADPRFDSPNIRGFDGRQAQFLNGLRMMRTSGAPAVDVYGLERVDVILGPSSVMYGQGNPGGLINMISKRPRFESFGEVGVGAGSFDNYQTFFDFGGPVSEGGNVAYRLTGLARNAHAQTDGLDNDRYLFAPSLTFELDDDTKLTILTSVQHDNPSSPSGLPYQLTLDAGAYTLPRDFTVGDRSIDRSDRTLTNLGYELEHRISEDWTLRQNLRYTKFDWDYTALGMSSLGLAADGRTIRRIVTIQNEDLQTFNVDNHLQGEVSTGNVDHTLLFGLDYRHFANDVTTQFWNASSLDAFTPRYGGPIALTSRSVYTHVNSTLNQLGFYAQDEIAFENWRATLGLRQDWASTQGTSSNPATGATRPLNKDDQKLTGRAGLSYLFDQGIAPYISYATSFEPVPVPSSGNLLEPTTGEQVEIGIKYRPEGWNALFTAAAYDLRQKNVLTTTVVNGVSQTSQIGEVRVKGLELQAVASLAEGLDLSAAYTHAKAEIVGGREDGNRPDNLPEDAASLWLKYTFQPGTMLEGLGVGGGVRYIGQRYGNTANTFDLDHVTLFDAGLSYERNGVRASLNVQNIADEKYLASCSTFGCFYGDGRSVMGRLSYSW
ncbi:TonB-dependent siderophore receptor [Rhizobium sp. SSA_523]|uniref:TonB-dependent siderophore receptor n=1 Tax=Rhizobium sp. SSA_523 TaxID=2952477 RepID=UPI002090E2D6|nr:TonB-dependent siderophore receptor [Rhizobium sp. SSA_523]MCO5734225.1 TonB-dependent siderophore receptor [Rhizobium sp. SSA_523]WKC22532.1 TonB-dependent siderophore receptor [Rhizobium sp. SSA_523]